jgi:hypothetical protein
MSDGAREDCDVGTTSAAYAAPDVDAARYAAFEAV